MKIARSRLFLFIFLGSATLVNSFNMPANAVTRTEGGGTIYYFSASRGRDRDTCTDPAKPCQSISKLNSLYYRGGDTIALLAGDVWSITSDAPAIVGPNEHSRRQNYLPNGRALTITTFGPGKCAPVDRIVNGCATFELSRESSLKGGWIIDNASNIVLENILIVAGTATALQFQAGSGLFIYNDRNNGAGLVVRNIGVQDDANLIRVQVSSGSLSNVVIENSRLAGSTPITTVDNGILIQGNLSNCTIQHNKITNIGGHISGAAGYYGGGSGNGILISDGAHDCTVQYNDVSYFGSNINSCGGPAGIWTYVSKNITIQFNESRHGAPKSYTTGCDWDGFDIDAGSSNVVVQFNYSHDNYGAAFNFYQCDRGDAQFRDNIYRYNVSRNDSSTLQMGAVAVGGCNNTSTRSAIYNNTIYTHVAQHGSREMGVCLNYLNDTDALFANNICWNDDGSLMVHLYGDGLRKFSGKLVRNDYFQKAGQPEFRYLFGSVRRGLAAWQSASGQDMNSVSEDPRTRSEQNSLECPSDNRDGLLPCFGPYVLRPDSPLIGVGMDLRRLPYRLDVGRRDYFGNTLPHSVGTGYNIGADGAAR